MPHGPKAELGIIIMINLVEQEGLGDKNLVLVYLSAGCLGIESKL